MGAHSTALLPESAACAPSGPLYVNNSSSTPGSCRPARSRTSKIATQSLESMKCGRAAMMRFSKAGSTGPQAVAAGDEKLIKFESV